MAKRNEFAKFLKVIQRIKLSTLNKAGKSAVSRTTKFVREGYNISKKMIEDRLKESKARSATDPMVGLCDRLNDVVVPSNAVTTSPMSARTMLSPTTVKIV